MIWPWRQCPGAGTGTGRDGHAVRAVDGIVALLLSCRGSVDGTALT